MEHLWTPWRYHYVVGGEKTDPRRGVPPQLHGWPGDRQCVFCNMLGAVEWAVQQGMDPAEADKTANIVERGRTGYLVLNAYPYNSGHIMAVPYVHQHSLSALDLATADELTRLLRRAETALRMAYKPHGLNMGLNLGEAAGAGVVDHLHWHVVPRWNGDGNYMSVLAETRVLPEMLDQAWTRIREALAAIPFEA
ncbi:ATP adenylyltransferase [Bryocella elongata]|uniref:ATP adenylyltransferase n=2 Tax=Bryocella elongata TaxID=863522 RepID=A0A1H6BMF6_9BACT|nr:ATP adenylyltransferase [Bryocella elongata]